VDILDLPTPPLLVERGAFDRNVATMAAKRIAPRHQRQPSVPRRSSTPDAPLP
jgi:hypothetical protein